MTRLNVMMTIAAAAVGFGSSASAAGETATLCHVTGPARGGALFHGRIITVAQTAVVTHLAHRDVVVGPTALRFFTSRRQCAVDAAGNLYDAEGNLVQSAGGSLPPPPVPT